jgi:Na+-driven multidrug efflux pump
LWRATRLFPFFFDTLVRTSGKQKVGVIANFVACYLVGVPLGLVLSFHYRQSILGLWWGQVLSQKEIKTKKKKPVA